MKTLIRQSTNTSGKVEVEFQRVKDEQAKIVVGKDGWKYGKKVEWKIATQGYGKKSVKKVEEKKIVDITEGLSKKPYQKSKKS